MKSKLILVLIIWGWLPIISGAQNEAFELFEQRADDLRLESKKLEDKQKALSKQMHDLEVENKRLRGNATYYQKELVRNETALRQTIQDLYSTDYALRVKIAEIALLEHQVLLLQGEKDSLGRELGNLHTTDSLLKKQLEVVQSELEYVSRGYKIIEEAAKQASIIDNIRHPLGYRRGKLLDVWVAEGGLLNVAKGGSTGLSVYSYLLPSRNLLGGLGIGVDFYSKFNRDGVSYGSFLLAPITASIRGNFGPQDFFALKRDPEALRFNMNWLVDFGWSLLIKDTDTASSYGGNAFISGGIGVLWPQYKTLAIGFSSAIRVQRIKRFDSLGNSDAFLFPMFVMKASFFLRK